jgi:hypothetical protein
MVSRFFTNKRFSASCPFYLSQKLVVPLVDHRKRLTVILAMAGTVVELRVTGLFAGVIMTIVR